MTSVRLARTADRGSVTAEFVVLLPAVMVVLSVCLGGMVLVAQQVRLESAAGAAARSAARGGDSSAGSLVPGAIASRNDHGDLVCVTLAESGRLGVFGALPLEATSCALADGQ